MKLKVGMSFLSVALLATSMASAHAASLTGDYIATQDACAYLVEISGAGRTGSVIHIEAGSDTFSVDLKFICGAGDPCQPGQVATQELASEIVGRVRESGEGGVQIVDGEYSDNGNHFVETLTDLGLPDQEGSGQAPQVEFEATVVAGGVNLAFDGKTSCLLTAAQ